MKFFSSDLHFGSNQSLIFDNRPFKNYKQFIRKVVKIWNKQTKKDDDIYIVGDFIDYHPNRNSDWQTGLKVVKKLKANVVLIIGNNEERLITNCFDGNFEKFKDYCLNLGFKGIYNNFSVNVCDTKFYLTHKAKNHSNDMLTLFGHSHRAMGIYKSFGFHIWCDLNHFRLFDENDIAYFLKMKNKHWSTDENLGIL